MWFLFGEVSSSSGCLGWVILLWYSLSLPYNYLGFGRVYPMQLLSRLIQSSVELSIEFRCPKESSYWFRYHSYSRVNVQLGVLTYLCWIDHAINLRRMPDSRDDHFSRMKTTKIDSFHIKIHSWKQFRFVEKGSVSG